MKKRAVYPIVMSSLALICFVAALLYFSTFVKPPYLGASLLVIPAVLLAAVAFYAGKGKLSAASTAALTTVLAIVLLLVSIFYSVALMWASSDNVTDVRYYGRAYQRLDDVKSVKNVFPKSIPSDAKDVRFSYSPQMLQGGETLKLSYTATEEKLPSGRKFCKARRYGSDQTKNGTMTIVGRSAARTQRDIRSIGTAVLITARSVTCS